MPIHTPPPPGGPRKKPWKKSDLPGAVKKGHGTPPGESKAEKAKKALGVVGGVIKEVSDGVEKVKLGDVASAAGKKVGDVRAKHKRKIWLALGLAAALGTAKGGSVAYEAIQKHRQDAATEQVRETPLEHISVPLTMGTENGQPSIEWKSGATTDDCGESHDMMPAATGVSESLRKGRTRLPKGSVQIIVIAHGQKLTYESDTDIVIDGEARDYSIDATLTKSEPAK